MKRLIVVIAVTMLVIVATYEYAPNEEVISLSNEEIYLVIEDEVIREKNSVIIVEGNIYISFDIFKKHIDSNIFYDENEETIVVTTYDKVTRLKVDDDIGTINNKEIHIKAPLKIVDNKIYISMEVFKNEYNMEVSYIKDTGRVVLNFLDSKSLEGEIVLENGHIRTSPNIKSAMCLKNLDIGTNLKVYEEYNGWYKVRTQRGIVGYIESNYIKIKYFNEEGPADKDNIKIKNENKNKINLTWDHLTKKMDEYNDINYIEGINAISPTWFSIIDDKGTIKDIGNIDYVKKYKNLGYQVWGLVDNSFNSTLTHEILKSSLKREKIILNLLDVFLRYDLDGINIDFENINIEDKDLFVQFVRELTPVFREKGKKVSVNVTPISVSKNWSKSYDRKALAETVDYVILMAYDQHWRTCPKAGSVAQYIWVEDSLLRVFEEIPNEKLILGIPFYTRLWKVEEVGGKEKVTSKALSMEAAEEFINQNNIKLSWDKDSGQYYGEKNAEEGIKYRIWIEDEQSIAFKTSLVNKYDLAGIASWRKGFEKREIWEVIEKQLN